jgi:hypothetical protein
MAIIEWLIKTLLRNYKVVLKLKTILIKDIIYSIDVII